MIRAFAAKSGRSVHSQIPSPSYDVFKFRRFRFNLICLLRLPLDISERDLREAVLDCSVNVFADYVIRARRAIADSPGPVEVTVRQAAHSTERLPARAVAV
jgi:hypothetical protein